MTGNALGRMDPNYAVNNFLAITRQLKYVESLYDFRSVRFGLGAKSTLVYEPPTAPLSVLSRPAISSQTVTESSLNLCIP